MHRNTLTRHLSYANVMATIGVFIALGGAECGQLGQGQGRLTSAE
jgi:hypothetical protein